MSVYGDIILDHYHYPRNFKALEKPTASVDVDNPLCGDKLHFEIVEHDDLIESVGFTGEGCAVSLASASMLTEHVKGKSI
ncbi:MAG: iron-sulfur cluster assembly scaffold protein, partial [Weeksellaceae bacterium]